MSGEIDTWPDPAGGGSGTTHHEDLDDVAPDQHHAQVHALNGADHSGTLSHDVLADVSVDDHHAKSHVHLADGSGTVAHSSLSGISATDHHAAPAAGPDADTTIDAAGAAGTVATFSRSGHGHKVSTTDAPSGAAITVDAAASVAATGAIARAAHGHRLNTWSTSPSEITGVAPGTSGAAPSRGDHSHGLSFSSIHSSADVNLVTTTWVDVLSFVLVPGVWIIGYSLTCTSPTNFQQRVASRLRDTTDSADICSAGSDSRAGGAGFKLDACMAGMAAYAVAGGSSTIKLQAWVENATAGVAAANPAVGGLTSNVATTLWAIRVA